MFEGESCRERQVNELEVLKSIFGEELRDLRKNRSKKKWQPVDIIITLTPQKGMSGPAEVYAQIDLHITCSENYPEVSPQILLKNSRGLSHQQVAVLMSELHALSSRLLGEVMIFELAQHVQKFLHEHNKPSYSSFYEEMVQRQQEKKECEMQKKRLEEDKQRQVLQAEIQKRQAALKAELRNSRESSSLESESSLSQSIPSSPHERIRSHLRSRFLSLSDSCEGCICEHRGTKLLHFDNNKFDRKIHRIQCLGHGKKGSVVYAGVDMTSGDLFAITEWILKCNTNGNLENKKENDIQHYLKQIASIEQELNHLYKLHHQNLVHYLNMKYVQDENNLVIYILQEYVVGNTCSNYLGNQIPLNVDQIRYIAAGILSPLKFLHENSVVHKDLRDSSVHITPTGVKISDYSVDKRLSDMYRASRLNDVVEDDFPAIQGRGGKKFDIYRFGILLLSLLKGCIVTEKNLNLDLNIPTCLKDFLSKCLASEERMRWSAEQLLQHSFIQTPLDRGVTPPRLDFNPEENEPEKPDTDIHVHFPVKCSQSRIQNDFEILKWLGKGAFGDVLKVRHKFDGRFYAIKRIKLNPQKRNLNRKIMREVKLLSRLCHENVVRYYNSWIESATLEDTSWHSEDTQSTTPSVDITGKIKSLSISENFGSGQIEKLAPPLRDVEWNVSYESKPSAAPADSEEESSSSDSDEEWGFLMNTRSDSSDSIEFEHDETHQHSNSLEISQENVEKDEVIDDTVPAIKELQFMYIQMEFCEKSTLRTAIDSGLYKDEDRMWRLFREMVEGLTHIHQKGMIHRDLKPVNIFLDSNDHVKIGDFGLATTNILSTLAQNVDVEKDSQVVEKGTSSSYLDELGSLTGQVGTALYVAPELNTKVAKAIYNQKVDIYSLGIILFEMSYGPLSTGMERVKVLLNVRSKEINLPQNIEEKKARLLRWLLNHDPSQRPTAQELLVSEHLPVTQLEEVKETVRQTLTNRKGRAYKHLIESCLSQEVRPAEDITYDMNSSGRSILNSLSLKAQLLQESVRSKIIKVFQRHGGISLATPLLIPKSSQLYNLTDSCVKHMTRSGIVVCLPHDLRAPFARYVVWNNIQHIRRYAIERVYREKKVADIHPRELYECAFDIVSPMANNLMAEAELIFIVWEICNEIPQLRERNFIVRLNHTSLLQAIFMYCGIEREKYQDIYTILCDARNGKYSKFQVQTHLTSLCLTDQAMDTLFKLFETESHIDNITNVLKMITRRKGDAACLAKEGLKDMEAVIANTQTLGVKWPITIAPLMVHNIQQHSGVMYQINQNDQLNKTKRRRKRAGQDVIAAGGRYDRLLTYFRKVIQSSKIGKNYAAGISVSLDKLLCAINESTPEIFEEDKDGIDVVIYCEENQSKREKDMANVLKELWSLGLKAMTVELPNCEETLEYCRENLVKHIILLKDSERGSARIYSWERDRYQERKINIQDIAEHVQKQTENALPILNRSESKTMANSDAFVLSNIPVNVNVNFVLSDRDKLSGSGRRSFKNTILAQMLPSLQRIWHKVPIEVFAVFLEKNVIKKISVVLEIDEEEQEFQKSIQEIIDDHPRHKKYIKDICEEMRRVRNEKLRPVLALYSLTESRHFLIM